MHRTAPALGALLLVALSASAALPGASLIAPGQTWARELERAEAAGVAGNLLGETFLAGTATGGSMVWKLDLLGRPLWVHRAPGFGGAVAAWPDSGGVFAANVVGEGTDILVRSLDGEGGVAWQRTVGSPGDELARSAAATAEAVWVAGSTGRDALVARLDPDGTHRWSRRISTVGEDRFEALAPLPDGSVFAAGWSYDGVRNRVLLARLDGYGNPLWERSLTWDGAHLRAYAASATPQGEVLVAGLRSNGVVQMPFLARFDGAGQLLWQRVLEGEAGGHATGVASDAAGGAIVVGNAPGFAGRADAFLVRLAPTGGIAWSKHHDTGGDDLARGVAWTPAGLFTLGGTGSGVLTAVQFVDLPVRPTA